MKQIGIVLHTDGKAATVSVARASACEGCHRHAEGCSACSLLGGDRRHTARVRNPIGARKGDRVEIEARDAYVLAYAALVFLFPLLAAALAYVVAAPLLSGAYAWLAAAAAFVLAFLIVCAVSALLSRKEPLSAIVAVISPKKEEAPPARGPASEE